MTHATILTVWMSKGTVRVAGRGPRQISLRTPSRAKSTWLMRMKERTVARLAGRHAGRDTSTTPLQDRKRPERFTIIGAVAQRLEQRTHNPLVLGSNPSSPTFPACRERERVVGRKSRVDKTRGLIILWFGVRAQHPDILRPEVKLCRVKVPAEMFSLRFAVSLFPASVNCFRAVCSWPRFSSSWQAPCGSSSWAGSCTSGQSSMPRGLIRVSTLSVRSVLTTPSAVLGWNKYDRTAIFGTCQVPLARRKLINVSVLDFAALQEHHAKMAFDFSSV